jgi:predicted nucleotidyltransferase
MFGLSETVIDQVSAIVAKYPQVKKIIIYGSRAKGNYKKGSDIDLTLIGKNINLRMLHRLEMDIDDLLLPYTFDISIFDQIENTDLIDHINRVGKLFYQAE